MTRRFTSSVGAALVLAVAACQPREAPPAPSPGAEAPVTKASLSPEQAAEARRTIVAWLECEECESGELKAVVKLGATAVPSLTASLREGPSPANRERLRLQLVDTHAKLKEQAAKRPELKIGMSEDEYVKAYMDNYVALYRVRAAQGLAAIGGPEALRALEAAAADASYRDDVKDAVKQALAGMKPKQ